MGASGQDRSDGLESHLVSTNSRYIQDQQEQQQLIMQDQDEQLELVTGSIRVLKDMSGRIGDELDQQAVMLGEFGEEMDQTGSRMDSVLKKMEKVSHMTSSELTHTLHLCQLFSLTHIDDRYNTKSPSLSLP
nr:syntaxin-10-like [Oncorhynchus nerka]